MITLIAQRTSASSICAARRHLISLYTNSVSQQCRTRIKNPRKWSGTQLNMSSQAEPSAKTVPITFIDTTTGEEIEVQAQVGKHMLDVAQDNNIELEGACGGECACATCHLVFDQETYDSLPEKVDEEDDMLDLAFELTDTSRLGCQVTVREDFAGIKIRIPDDGY